MSTVRDDIAEILRYVKPAPLWATKLGTTTDGPLLPGLQYRTHLVMPVRNANMQSGFYVDITAFDEISFKMRFYDPYGYPSREHFYQMYGVES